VAALHNRNWGGIGRALWQQRFEMAGRLDERICQLGLDGVTIRMVGDTEDERLALLGRRRL